MSYTV